MSSHVVMPHESTWECLHCGKTQRVTSSSLDAYVLASDIFLEAHRTCEPEPLTRLREQSKRLAAGWRSFR